MEGQRVTTRKVEDEVKREYYDMAVGEGGVRAIETALHQEALEELHHKKLSRTVVRR